MPGKTSIPETYVDGVFKRLRGLTICDNVSMPSKYKLTSPEQIAALEFLSKVTEKASRAPLAAAPRAHSTSHVRSSILVALCRR